MSDIDERVVVQVVDSSKLTAKLVLQLMRSYYEQHKMNHQEAQREKVYRKRQKLQEPKTGKQTLKELMNQNRQLTFVPLEERKDLLALQKELKHYSVDFSVVKEGKTTWQIFFKAQDAEVFNQAFKKVLGQFDPNFQKGQSEKLPVEKQKEPSKEINPEQEIPLVEPKNKKDRYSEKKGPLTVMERLEKAKQEAQAFNQSVQKESSRMQRRHKRKEVEK